MRKFNDFIGSNIQKILTIFLFLQPIIDVIAAISINYLHISFTFSSIIRMIFLVFCVYFLIFINKTEKRKINIRNVLFIIIYFILFSETILVFKDSHALIYELKNVFNTFYFPIVLIALIDMTIQYKINLNLKNIVYIYFIYLLFIIIPNLTNTGFLSYSHSKVGNVGWFLSANAVGNILSFLLPLIIYYLIKAKTKIFFKFIITICIIYVMVSIGTKVPLLSMAICIFCNLLYFLLKWFKEKKYRNIKIASFFIILCISFSTFLMPKTAFYKNIQIHKNYLGINNYLEIFTKYELIDHFIFSQRLTFLKNTNANFKNAHWLEKLNGIGYIENYGTDEVSLKTIEIDYFEILYRSGIVGTMVYLIILIPALKNVLKKVNSNSLIYLEYRVSILLIALLSLFSGHTLVTPSVSIFIAIIFVLILKGGFDENFNQR